MPAQDNPVPTPEAADSAVTQMLQAPASRRSVLRRGAVASALGLAVAAGGGTAIAAAMSSQSKGDSGTVGGAAGSGPIVIYIPDPRSGEMDIFAGATKTHARNQAMASMVASMSAR